MSAYQMVVRSKAAVFQGVSVRAVYERFLDWWVSLYADPPRKLRGLI